MKDDLVEEIQDLYNEIKESEKNFKKVLEVTCKSFFSIFQYTNFGLFFYRIHDKQEQRSF